MQTVNISIHKAVLLSLMLLSTTLIAAQDSWDIANTGEPFTEATFSVNEGTWLSVDVSPDGRTLVFDLLGNLYTLPAAGGEATLVHGGPAMFRQPSFSPDGSQLLFLSDSDGANNLWVSNIDGSQARQITRETTDKLTNPAWGPNGEYVIASKSYSELSKMGNWEIWMFYLGGGKGRVLVPTPENKKAINEAQFAEGGRYLYYTHDVSTATTFLKNPLQPNSAIKRRDMNDGTTTEIVRGFGGAATAQISPDGKRIAFVRRVKTKTVLFIYDSETGEQRPVYDDLDRDALGDLVASSGYYPHFDWFPDGENLVIWGKGKFYKINVSTADAQEIPFSVTVNHRITKVPRFENDLSPKSFTARSIQHIAVAPNNSQMVFNALGHLWQKELPDGRPERLTRATDFEYEPAFSPDGKQVAYVSWHDEKGSELRVVSAGGGKARTLVKSRGAIRQPAFSHDGKSIVYFVQKGSDQMGGYRARPGVYIISAKGGEPEYVTESAYFPRFSPDDSRIYYDVRGKGSNKLESVRLDGLDRRVHATGTDAGMFQLSPDQRWLAFRQHYKYYVIPYRETGSPLAVAAQMTEMPVGDLTRHAGYELTWSHDSGTLYWMLGEELFSAKVSERFVDNATIPENGMSVGLQVATDVPEGMVAFTNGRIITMKGQQVIERGTLLVRENKIVAVGPVSQITIPDGAKIIDISGKTLMPGLVDMHGHLGLFRTGLSPQKHSSHYAALAFGVTTNFDPSTADQPNYAVGEMNKAGIMVGPRIISTGEVLLGNAGSDFHVPIDGIEDARSAVARKRALGGIIIKSYGQPMRSQRQQLIKAAREAKIMVAPEGEWNFHNDISMVLDGHGSIEHNIPLANYYDDVIQLMAHSETASTPTLIVLGGELQGENYMYQTTRPWQDPKIKTYVQNTASLFSPVGGGVAAPPYVRGMVTMHVADELWNVGFRSVARSLKKMDDAGVLVNIGSHGEIQGINMHWEMWLLSEGGMSNLRVLRAATLNGAKTLGLDRQIGSLEPGKLADLLVLDANPLDDIHNTNTVRYTMINGRLYDSLSMDEIGNYDRPRSKFYWELEDYKGIDWNESWSGDDKSIMNTVPGSH